MLGLEKPKAAKVVTELAKDRKHTTLVQVRGAGWWALGAGALTPPPPPLPTAAAA